MKTLFLILNFLPAVLFFTNTSLADTNQTNINEIPVYLDGKLVSRITNKQILNSLILGQGTIKNIPTQNHWYSVVIKNTNGTDLSFQNWQKNYRGKEIILSIKNNKLVASLHYIGNSKPAYLLENVVVIFIETTPPEVAAANNPPLPPLYIVMGNKSTLLDYPHLGTAGQHGWQLTHILSAIQRGAPAKKMSFNQFTLACENGAQKLTLARPLAEDTFLKVNQRNQWRAIVIDNEQKSKKNWKKCRHISEISLS
jgi:hypothetical protein